jgi:hypothetical protein
MADWNQQAGVASKAPAAPGGEWGGAWRHPGHGLVLTIVVEIVCNIEILAANITSCPCFATHHSAVKAAVRPLVRGLSAATVRACGRTIVAESELPTAPPSIVPPGPSDGRS